MGSQMHSDDVDAIHAMIEPWSEACIKRDWTKLLSMCTDEMVFMPPDGPEVKGSDIQEWLDTFPVIKDMWWNIEHIDGAGETAYLRGAVKQTFDIDGVEQKFEGKYTDVLRKGADGAWRFESIIWNSNLPPAAP